MRTRWLALAVIGGVALGAAAHATTIRRLTLEEVTGHAAEIFVGRVTGMRVVDGGTPRNLLYTEVTFGDLSLLKGRAAGQTLTYRFAGGARGERTVRVVGVPEFEVGRRYVVFANAKLDWLCPAIGWWQGRYVVAKDPGTGAEILLDSGHRPVYGFTSGEPVTKRPDAEARPMSVAAFLSRVREIVRAQEAATAGEGTDDTTEDDMTEDDTTEGERR